LFFCFILYIDEGDDRGEGAQIFLFFWVGGSFSVLFLFGNIIRRERGRIGYFGVDIFFQEAEAEEKGEGNNRIK
jgi:hypothetical protein